MSKIKYKFTLWCYTLPTNAIIWQHLVSTTVHVMLINKIAVCLWPPYEIGQAIIFLPYLSFFLFFSTNLSRHRAMSTILLHMVWP